MSDPEAHRRPYVSGTQSPLEQDQRISLVGLPDDDLLVINRLDELDLADREAAACRRLGGSVSDWNRDGAMGPTEAWRLFLADSDPEWHGEVVELPSPRTVSSGAVA